MTSLIGWNEKKLCSVAYAAACSGDHTKPKFAKIKCTAILRSLQQREACLSHRKLIQKECFGDKPDAGTQDAE